MDYQLKFPIGRGFAEVQIMKINSVDEIVTTLKIRCRVQYGGGVEIIFIICHDNDGSKMNRHQNTDTGIVFNTRLQ